MMKKILFSILFLVLMIRGNALAEILDLGNGVKINIPNNFEYFRLPHEANWKYTAQALGATEKLIEDTKHSEKTLGFRGTEKITVIGKKGIAKGLGSLRKHLLEGKNIQTWEEYSRISKACRNKGSLILKDKCRRKELFKDPTFQILMADETSTEIKKITKFFDRPLDKIEKKEIEEFKKSSDYDFDKYKTEQYTAEYKGTYISKLVISGNQWFFEKSSEIVMHGIKSKTREFHTVLNDHFFYINSQCWSQKTCKNIDQLMIKIIEPSFSLDTTKIKKFDINKKEEMIKMFNTVKNGYRYYKLAKLLTKLLIGF